MKKLSFNIHEMFDSKLFIKNEQDKDIAYLLENFVQKYNAW